MFDKTWYPGCATGRLLSAPPYDCSASHMFVSRGIPAFSDILRKLNEFHYKTFILGNWSDQAGSWHISDTWVQNMESLLYALTIIPCILVGNCMHITMVLTWNSVFSMCFFFYLWLWSHVIYYNSYLYYGFCRNKLYIELVKSDTW